MAEGSLNGLLKGKFYNRCTRIHQLLAAALEKALFIKYLEHNNDDKLLASSIMDQGDLSQELTEQLVEDVRVINLMDRYKTYLHSVMKGEYGHTAVYWATYVYFINRFYCELLCTVRTDDIESYINVILSVINICFSLHIPNYAPWGSLFLNKFSSMDSQALEILKDGAFSIRRTKKSCARSDIDLTLEQTVNRDAASPATGISAFRNLSGGRSLKLSEEWLYQSYISKLTSNETKHHPTNSRTSGLLGIIVM